LSILGDCIVITTTQRLIHVINVLFYNTQNNSDTNGIMACHVCVLPLGRISEHHFILYY